MGSATRQVFVRFGALSWSERINSDYSNEAFDQYIKDGALKRLYSEVLPFDGFPHETSPSKSLWLKINGRALATLPYSWNYRERLRADDSEVENAKELAANGDRAAEEFVNVDVVGRLLGGKGGFGTLLRGKGSKGPKTTNFESSRDLQGRKLRNVQAASRVKQWVHKTVHERMIVEAAGGVDPHLGKAMSAAEVMSAYNLTVSEESHNPFQKDAAVTQAEDVYKSQMKNSAALAVMNMDINAILHSRTERRPAPPQYNTFVEEDDDDDLNM